MLEVFFLAAFDLLRTFMGKLAQNLYPIDPAQALQIATYLNSWPCRNHRMNIPEQEEKTNQYKVFCQG